MSRNQKFILIVMGGLVVIVYWGLGTILTFTEDPNPFPTSVYLSAILITALFLLLSSILLIRWARFSRRQESSLQQKKDTVKKRDRKGTPIKSKSSLRNPTYQGSIEQLEKHPFPSYDAPSYRSTTETERLPNGYTREEYRQAGFTDQDIATFGLDQPGAPPPGVAPFAIDDLMRQDDPWDEDLGGWGIDLFDSPRPYGDLDHDGIPNRFDHDMDGDGIPDDFDPDFF